MYAEGLVCGMAALGGLPCAWLWHASALLCLASLAARLQSLLAAYDRDGPTPPTVELEATADGCAAAAAAAATAGGDAEAARGLDAGAVGPEELRGHAGRASCWVAVGGIVCDVTAFLDEHPGGPESLLVHGGADASAAFEAAGHSAAARRQVAQLAVGPLQRRPCEQEPTPGYDLMSEPRGASELALAAAHAAALAAALVSARALPGERSASSVLLPMAAVGAGSLALPSGPRAGASSRLACAPGAALATLVAAAQLAPWRGLALGAAATLLAESFARPATRWPPAAVAGWALLALHLVPGADGWPRGDGQDCSCFSREFQSCLAAAATATALRTLCHTARAARDYVVDVVRVAGALSLLASVSLRLIVAGAPGDAFSWPAWLGLASPSAAPAAVGSVAFTLLAALLLRTLADLVALGSAGGAAAWLAMVLGPAAAAAELWEAASTIRALAVLGWVLQVVRLARELEASVRGPPRASGPLALACVRAHFLVDNCRTLLALLLWRAAGKPLEAAVSALLPTGLRVWAFEAPIDDLGGQLRAGVCLMLRGAQAAPGHVVCNVGHLPTADVGDVRATVKASLDIMRELGGLDGRGPPAPGFVGQLLCVVPEVGAAGGPMLGVNWRSVQEINLSIWSSPEAAAEWYRGSPAHAGIVAAHAGHGPGRLRTFGNLLLSLKPLRVSWQRRCRACAGVAEGLDADRCPSCDGSTFPLPAF
ncbi:unnamed protein product [Prorocentrum cordatum]|uniref:Cytochrome b5 heme-binding domain-containing protein n=1 Tax=Prorocentrum cordatum TaxID=2364126 RepID=A0ABN9T396_9DINO|nr:unnamed protein product [Polarella glacialis]